MVKRRNCTWIVQGRISMKLANINSVDIVFSFYLISAQVFRKLDQLDSSFYYFRKCFDVSNKYNYSYGKAESQTQMGAIAILQKKYTDAEKYLLAGIEEAKAINYFAILDEGYKDLADIYAEPVDISKPTNILKV